jgi:hypothetical protein
MTARKIEWNGEWIATLLEDELGSSLVPPIVFDQDGQVVLGAEVLEAIAEARQQIEHPILRDYTPGKLAELEQHLTRVRNALIEGVQ